MSDPATDGPDTGVHEEFEARFSDLQDGLLPEAERDRVLAHLAGCAPCKAAYAEMQEAVTALGGLGRTPAPATFTHGVTETINRRSGGRFFGRRTLGDRVPFGVLLIVALVVLVAIAGVLWSSSTGSLRVAPDRGAPPPPAPGARDAVMPP